MTERSVADRADEIMEQAVAKAGELLCTQPMIAEIVLKQLLRCDPEHLSGLQLLGLCKHRMGQHAEAVEIIQTALELDPTNADNWNNIGLAYAGLGSHQRAIESIQKAIELNPKQSLFKNNLALQHRIVGQYQEAVKILSQGVEDYATPQMWVNLGGIYGEMKELDKAKECFDNALKLEPEHPASHIDLAFYHFLKGELKEGFEKYEWRFWYYPQMGFYMKAYDQHRLWAGTNEQIWQDYGKGPDHNVSGKKVLIYGEQGMGDIIQFSRYAKDLKALGAHVTIHCPEALKGVISRIEGVDAVCTRDIVNNKGEEFPEYDYQFAMMSFPHKLQKYEPTGEPYIKPVTTKFREHMDAEYGDTFNVGVVWAGSPAHPHDRRRSIPLKHFQPLHDTKGVKLFSLQMDGGRRQYGATYRSYTDNPAAPNVGGFQIEGDVVDYADGCDKMKLVDLTKMIQSFEDTCTILAGLDLVICCDTAVAHLAGAMGVPCWLLLPYNPDWRWGIEGERTKWYDSIWILRQPERDDWDSVFKTASEVLNALVLQNQ